MKNQNQLIWIVPLLNKKDKMFTETELVRPQCISNINCSHVNCIGWYNNLYYYDFSDNLVLLLLLFNSLIFRIEIPNWRGYFKNPWVVMLEPLWSSVVLRLNSMMLKPNRHWCLVWEPRRSKIVSALMKNWPPKNGEEDMKRRNNAINNWKSSLSS